MFILIAARALDGDDFGRVALVVALAISANELHRSFSSHPLALEQADVSERAVRSTAAFGWHVAVATFTGGSVAAALFVAGISPVIALGALVYPLVAAQDGMRITSVHGGKPGRAVLVDSLWFVSLLGGATIALAVGADDLIFILLWGCTAGVSTFLAAASSRMQLSRAVIEPYARANIVVGGKLATHSILEAIPGRILPVVVVAAIAIENAGSLRAAETVLGGSTLVWSAIGLSTLRRARVRVIDQRRPFAAFRYIARMQSITIAVLIANVAVALALPDVLGEGLLDDKWQGARSFILFSATLLGAEVIRGIVNSSLRANLALREVIITASVAAALATATVPLTALRWGAKAALVVDAGCILVGASLGLAVLYKHNRTEHRAENRPSG